MSIPRIDLRDYRQGDAATRSRFIQTLGDGLKDVGFLVVSGHGLDAEVIDRTYGMFRDFFALPDDVKRKYDVVAGGARGYTPFGREHAKYTNVPDLKEFWHTGQELPEGHSLREEYPDNVWANEMPDMKEYVVKLYRGFEECASTLLTALAEYFEFPTDTFSKMMVDGNSILRTIHYPPLSEDMPAGAVRAAAHEDINLITLLIESQGAGLEILTQDNRWEPVHALEGDIIVDSGDMLSRLCNGVIPATTHRVVNPAQGENKSRYSMPFFVHPYSACDLTVMDHFVSEDRPAKWPPITAGAFLQQRLDEIGLSKKD
ncbi:Isopenicillin N synthase family oxygenase [Sulfidibacter corallicola]|uniref:Isopenicillin N synthase family oxygenase n=1 Tax=Sulfidibacter corallicola TaxID=2818388 RepID=A0A8A4TQ10_SULCO|nr:2-oxoglutarate and iron-dependent oxygenase domain-containing protein [Sulfidibacter corallicola]QTD51274.1 isopenicillin N synthase family oxygenase [Sulfidibacter corallicola]